jgi:RecA-family ATPase
MRHHDMKLAERINAIAKAKGIAVEPGWFFPLSLRGMMSNPEVVLQKIREKALEIGAGLIIIDPAYKFIAGKDENAAGDIAEFLNKLERVCDDPTASMTETF